MTNLVDVLHAFSATVTLLVGSVALSYKGTVTTIEDDSHYTRWAAVEEHFCGVYRSIKPAPLQPDDLDCYTPEDIGAYHGCMLDILESEVTRTGSTYGRRVTDYKESNDQKYTKEYISGYDAVAFPDQIAARKFFIENGHRLPKDAYLCLGEKEIRFSQSRGMAIQQMVDLVHSVFREAVYEDKSPAEQCRILRDCARELNLAIDKINAEQEKEKNAPRTVKEDKGAKYKNEQQKVDSAAAKLLEMWGTNTNTEASEAYLSTNYPKGSLNAPAAKRIWDDLPEGVSVREAIKRVAQSIRANEDEFTCLIHDAYGAAVGFIMARKGALSLVNGRFSKKL